MNKPIKRPVFHHALLKTARMQLGPAIRFVGSVNGKEGIWVSFSIDNSGDDNYRLMLPAKHAESDFPWKWLGWGAASLALLVAWLIAWLLAPGC